MPAGFLDMTDMSDIKREMRRKKQIIIRWHLYTLLSLNPTLLKYRFRNAVKRRNFNLDLINQMNPSLYWPSTTMYGGNVVDTEMGEKDEKVDGGVAIETLSGDLKRNFYVGQQKVDVRYRKTGTVLEVIYSLKDAVAAAARKSASVQSALDEFDNGENETQKVVQYFQDDDEHKNVSTDGEIEENIELVNYRRLSSNASNLKEIKEDDVGSGDNVKNGDIQVVNTSETDEEPANNSYPKSFHNGDNFDNEETENVIANKTDNPVKNGDAILNNFGEIEELLDKQNTEMLIGEERNEKMFYTEGIVVEKNDFVAVNLGIINGSFMTDS